MQMIHGKKDTFRKRKYREPGLGSFFKGYTQAKEVLKNKKVVQRNIVRKYQVQLQVLLHQKYNIYVSIKSQNNIKKGKYIQVLLVVVKVNFLR